MRKTSRVVFLGAPDVWVYVVFPFRQVSGSVFTYGSIGGQVKEALGATEAEAQLIGVAGNVGLWTNVVGGLLLEKIGARPTIWPARSRGVRSPRSPTI